MSKVREERPKKDIKIVPVLPLMPDEKGWKERVLHANGNSCKMEK